METETNKNDDYFAEDHLYEGRKKAPYFRMISQGLIGLFFSGAGVYQLIRIQKWEATGGSIKMNDFQQLLYKLVGKWGIFAFLLGLGAVFFYKAYTRWRRIKVQERLS
ncbi:hypothetical protein [Chitinophaga nivalis]|uniref:DUF1206 domain-containing protein n=1 Tax=Chitinophaga nivalis TaxID=2991709 RepID=A0ABT3IRB3_9BACT|nr:hypothetical protein [Chitinophaga nivalis]MCW3464015.1 hypothetical protein [Chitinophaga nivalis]MCW3486295.1 hypothetical protein [Chitinophaga nivalis]